MNHLPIISLWFLSCLLAVAVFSNNSVLQKPTPVEDNTINNIHYISWKQEEEILFVDTLLNDPLFTQDFYLHKATSNFYDTISDTSIAKFVSRHTALLDPSYQPKNLTTLSSKVFTLSTPNLKIRTDAAKELEAMAKEFTTIFNKKLVIVSAHRSHAYQQSLKDKWCPDTLCAPAGHSEHQLWLAVDLFAATTADQFLSKKDFAEYYKWLADNAHRYWRHNTYQKWVEIDTYQVEPRHRRYLWRDLATELYNKKMTFGERIKTREQKNT